GTLFDTCRFHGIAHAFHRAERCIEQNAADRASFLGSAARSGRNVAAALFDLDLHVELAAGREVRDDVTGIDDLDIVRGFDIARRDYALALLAQVEQRLLAVMQLEYDTLQIEEDVDYVFLHTVDGRVLMQHTADLHF